MRHLLKALCATAIMGGGAVFLMAADKSDQPAKTEVQGELIDTYCYSSSGAKGEGHMSCATDCASSGIPVGILADGKEWVLATNPIPLSHYMSKTVRATGVKAKDSDIFVPDKVEVKDGDNWKEITLHDAHHGTEAAK